MSSSLQLNSLELETLWAIRGQEDKVTDFAL